MESQLSNLNNNIFNQSSKAKIERLQAKFNSLLQSEQGIKNNTSGNNSSISPFKVYNNDSVNNISAFNNSIKNLRIKIDVLKKDIDSKQTTLDNKYETLKEYITKLNAIADKEKQKSEKLKDDLNENIKKNLAVKVKEKINKKLKEELSHYLEMKLSNLEAKIVHCEENKFKRKQNLFKIIDQIKLLLNDEYINNIKLSNKDVFTNIISDLASTVNDIKEKGKLHYYNLDKIKNERNNKENELIKEFNHSVTVYKDVINKEIININSFRKNVVKLLDDINQKLIGLHNDNYNNISNSNSIVED